MVVKNMKQLMDVIEGKVIDALENEVFEEVRKTQKSNIRREVYNVYFPNVYERRKENGGLLSDDNIVYSIDSFKNDVVLSVFNITPPNKKWIHDDKEYVLDYDFLALSGDKTWLAQIIEYGTNNDSYAEEYEKARPFTKSTIEELKSSKKHIDALRQGLRARGLQTS